MSTPFRLIDDLQQLVNSVEALQPAIRRLIDDAEVVFEVVPICVEQLTRPTAGQRR